jgi:ATP-dependent protease HslVU (ClpYQ) peptidase subunit
MKLLTLLFCLLLMAPVQATTIAYDGHILAADSQRTQGNRKLDSGPKIHFSYPHKAWVACAGEVTQINLFLKWFDTDQSRPLNISSDSIEALVVYEDGKAFMYLSDSNPIEVMSPISIGSGQDFALSAMMCGKTATEAIALTETMDIYTGGKVQSVYLKH